LMKPKPLVSLNHFTVPVGIEVTPMNAGCARDAQAMVLLGWPGGVLCDRDGLEAAGTEL
jgi:hypothetical protein